MSRPIYLVKWSRPSRLCAGEMVNDFRSFFVGEEAKSFCEELQKTDGVTNVRMEETECTSL